MSTERAQRTPGERAYEHFQNYVWDKKPSRVTMWAKLTPRDQANWEMLADPGHLARHSAAEVSPEHGYILQAHEGQYWHVVWHGGTMVAREYPVGTEPGEQQQKGGEHVIKSQEGGDGEST